MTAPFRIGVIGLGTVGAALVRVLQSHRTPIATRAGRAIDVVAISARDKTRDRGFAMDKLAWFDDPLLLAQAEGIDCVVELVGGADGLPKNIVAAALTSGKHVVTANKALLAKHGNSLMALAEEHKRALNFEAAVAGGIPVIKTLRESLAGNQVNRVSGILNGTCNYILSRMEMEGLTFEDCLKDAQRLGYAEADPTFDVGGYDTAHKLALLTSLAFGSEIDADSVYVEGIASIKPLDLVMADELGYRIKLLGVAERNPSGIEQRVHPTMVPKSTAIAQVMGVKNAVTLNADIVGEVTLVGPGAGGPATASSVLSDLIDIARGIILPPLGIASSALTQGERAPMQRHEGGYYIRLTVRDRPGAAAGIATRMAEQHISLESIVQKRPPASRAADPSGKAGTPVPVVLITYATTEDAIRRALDAVMTDGHISEEPQLIRIERD